MSSVEPEFRIRDRSTMDGAKLVPELLCSSLEKNPGFYADLIGFTVLYVWPEDRFVYLGLEGSERPHEEAPAACDYHDTRLRCS